MGAADGMRAELGMPPSRAMDRSHAMPEVEDRPGSRAWRERFEAGMAMTTDQVVEYGLTALSPR
jgi:hypothetical protein